MEVDAGASKSLKRGRVSPPRDVRKRVAKSSPVLPLDDGVDSDDSSGSSCFSALDVDRDPSTPSASSDTAPSITDSLFRQIMRDHLSVEDLGPYLRNLGVPPRSLELRVRDLLSGVSKKGKHGKQRHRYRALLQKLTPLLSRS
jgi:hypothetical protein